MTSSYDAFGRLASSTIDLGGTSRALSYQWDTGGRRTRITHPDPGSGSGQAGVYFDTVHDPGSSPGQAGLGRPVALADQVTVRYILGYTPHGGPVGVIRNNRTQVVYGYDAIQRLASIAMGHDFPGYVEDLLILLARNPAGQLSTVSRNNNAYAWTGAYTVNRPTRPTGSQYSAAGGMTLIYDANGNLISETPPSPTPARTYTYDVENRLVGASGGVTLAYDPLGRLFSVASPGTQYRVDIEVLRGPINIVPD